MRLAGSRSSAFKRQWPLRRQNRSGSSRSASSIALITRPAGVVRARRSSVVRNAVFSQPQENSRSLEASPAASTSLSGPTRTTVSLTSSSISLSDQHPPPEGDGRVRTATRATFRAVSTNSWPIWPAATASRTPSTVTMVPRIALRSFHKYESGYPCPLTWLTTDRLCRHLGRSALPHRGRAGLLGLSIVTKNTLPSLGSSRMLGPARATTATCRNADRFWWTAAMGSVVPCV